MDEERERAGLEEGSEKGSLRAVGVWLARGGEREAEGEEGGIEEERDGRLEKGSAFVLGFEDSPHDSESQLGLSDVAGAASGARGPNPISWRSKDTLSASLKLTPLLS